MEVLNLGIDAGSTTVKIILLDENLNLIFSKYERHYSDILKNIKYLVNEILNKYSDYRFRVTFTGSGAIAISEYLEIPFVQEVIACKNAIFEYEPCVDVAIELGGEDAKIIYFGESIEQRMNGSCAGGTGAFLDQMAVLLDTDTIGLNELAKKGKIIYPIASRCGVFAKTDIQPLINEGAKKSDIAISIMQAVVNQTISGLACGKPIRGNVIFLGGPLNYLSELQSRFIKTLNLNEETAIIPKDSHLFVCKGAVLENVTKKIFTTAELKEKLKKLDYFKIEETSTQMPLFNNTFDYQKFIDRHNRANVNNESLEKYKGDAFLGIDAGSTTAKLVLISTSGKILYSIYKSNMGSPVETIKSMIIELYKKIPKEITIRITGSTGYGELLIKTAFNLDISEIETIAHYKAAHYFNNKVDSIIDIGGQDMKYIKIKNGVIDTIMLNEACSSGCGSFIESLVKSLDMKIEDFVHLAIKSDNPVDLGSRCTVFMNSKIKQTQKEGKSLENIFAGLSYSIVKNALLKVMKIRDISFLGENIVVQGGTFLNNAVLRAFEIITEKEVIRPNIAGLMGAYGIALICRDMFLESEDKNYISTILSLEEINTMTIKTMHTRCKGCENNCGLTINIFNDKKFISGNRCEKGSGNDSIKADIPNMYKYKYDKIFNRKSLSKKEAKRGIIGIPRVLNMYEDYPFWHTFFTELGFCVVLSDKSSRQIYESGIESMPSESVCFPAKLVHGHVVNLINKNVKTIFYPCIPYNEKEYKNTDNCYNCPIVISYSEAIKLNVEELKTKKIKFINPFLPMKSDKLLKRIMELEDFKKYKFTKGEVRRAIHLAFKTRRALRNDIIKKSKEILTDIINNNEKAICLIGRPYHLDPEINHGIDTMINNLGLPILSEDAICYKNDLKGNLRVVDQWTYHSRLYRSANEISKIPNLELIQLNSFGCGLDAVINDQVEEILKANNKLYTPIKIDEINNLGAAKIRVRSLIAAMKERKIVNEYKLYKYENIKITKKIRKKHTILFPDLSPYHFKFLEKALNDSNYNTVYLNSTNEKTVDTGLKYVNNDACYPSLIVIGQLVLALKSGKYDINNTSVMITQTGGGCRASNYIGLLRKALKDAGFTNVPVISFNFAGLSKSQSFKFSVPMLNRMVQGMIYADLLLKLYNATRPYEKIKNTTKKTYDKWETICLKSLEKANIFEYRQNIENIINDFKKIKIVKKQIPKVAVVGEILIKYHPFGNNHLVNALENEDTEVIAPELMGFIKYCAFNIIENEKLLKTSKLKSFIAKKSLDLIRIYEQPVIKNLKGTTFPKVTDIYKLSKNVDKILSTGNQTGEGWYLTAEILHLIENGVNNIVCVQPFACLPNHIFGKAVIKKIKELYPYSNIVAVDYDPGASHSNQINRIKLMLSVARKNKK